MAALSRMANRDHKIRVGEGDTVLMASSVIPGNENAISGVINGLTRWGATRRAQGQREGARLRARQRRRARLLLQHRPAHQRDAGPRRVAAPAGQRRPGDRAPASPPTNVVIAEDGVVVDLVDGHAKITGKVPAGNVYVDAQTVGGVTEATLKDRRTLAEEGVVTVLAIVDADTGKLADPPDFLVRGFVHDDERLRRRRPRDREDAGARGRRGHRRRPPARADARPRRRPLGPARRSGAAR